MAPVPELVVDSRCEIAEGPVWHPDEQCLYWTDIPAGKMYRYDPANGAYEMVYEGEQVGGMTIQSDGSLLLLGARGSARLWRDGRITDTILPEIPGEQGSRFNDVIADPEGRVFSGTMAVGASDDQIGRFGRLYRLDPNRHYRAVLDDMSSPNGMGFSMDLRRMYVTDSSIGVQSISRFDYDRDTGSLTNRHLFHQTRLDGSDGRPDGMAVDLEGGIWSAQWDGGAVVRFRPDGREWERFPLLVDKVTSVAFGGRDLSDLYITTARDGDARSEGSVSGGIFRLRTATRGRPEFRSRIGL